MQCREEVGVEVMERTRGCRRRASAWIWRRSSRGRRGKRGNVVGDSRCFCLALKEKGEVEEEEGEGSGEGLRECDGEGVGDMSVA